MASWTIEAANMSARQNEIADPEVRAMRDAYRAVSSRPFEERPRIMEWLSARLADDEKKHLAAKAAAAKIETNK